MRSRNAQISARGDWYNGGASVVPEGRGDVRRHAHPLRHRTRRPAAAEQLLPLGYEELRKLAARKMAQEKPGQTLQATALVHEACLRLVDTDNVQHWDSRGHFFAVAAMRRILVENARANWDRTGGGRCRLDLSQIAPECQGPGFDLLALSNALVGGVTASLTHLLQRVYPQQ